VPAQASGSSGSGIASSFASAALRVALAAASASAVGESAGAAARSLRRAAALTALEGRARAEPLAHTAPSASAREPQAVRPQEASQWQ
jgi:hypothetical protein